MAFLLILMQFTSTIRIWSTIEQLKEKIRASGKEKRYIDCFGQWYLKARATENADVPDNAYYDGAQTDRALEKLQKLKGGEKKILF